MMGWIALFLVVAVAGFLFYKCRAKGSGCCCGSAHEEKPGEMKNESKDTPKKPGCCS